MTLRESTKSMLDNMPDSDVKVIHDLTKTLFEKNASPLRPVSKSQVLKDLEISRNQIKNGEYKDFNEALDEIEKKYDL